MGNSAGAGSGAANGAKTGAQIYGAWGALIGAIVGGVTGYFSPDIVAEQRKSLLKYNAEVTKYTNKSIFDLQRSRVNERLRTTQALSTYADNKKTTLATLRAQYGASDVIGASSTALDQVLDFQTEQAVSQEWFNFDVGIDNFNMNVQSIVNTGISRLSNAAGTYVNPNAAAAAQSTMQAASDMYNKYYGGQQGSYNNTMSNLGLSSASTYSNQGGSSGFSSGFQFGSGGSTSGGASSSSMMSSGDWSSFSFGGS